MSEFERHVARLHEAFETQVLKRDGFYHELLDYLTNNGDLKKTDKIHCATTGHGTLYSILLKEGYDVYGNDGSIEMIRRLEDRIKRMGLEHRHEPTNFLWQELAQHYPKEFFDFIFTEGNSLIYVVSWAVENPDLSNAKDELEKAISNKSQILEEGGIWYVDIPKEDEEETIHEGRDLIVDGRTVNLSCRFHNDWNEKVRTFTMEEAYRDRERSFVLPSHMGLLPKSECMEYRMEAVHVLEITQKALLITGKELEDMTVPKYFSAIHKSPIGDPHYQGYILRK